VDIYRARQLVAERLPVGAGALAADRQGAQLMPIARPIGALLRFCLTSRRQPGPGRPRFCGRFATGRSGPGSSRFLVSHKWPRSEATSSALRCGRIPAGMRQFNISIRDIADAVGAKPIGVGSRIPRRATARLDVQGEARLMLDSAAPSVGLNTVVSMPTVAGTVGRARKTESSTAERPAVRLGDVAEIVSANEPAVVPPSMTVGPPCMCR